MTNSSKNKNKLDVLTIGDVSIDLYMKVAGDEVSQDKDPVQPKICFYHGSKIPVVSLKTNIAGNAINVALGVKTLGLKAAVYTEMGEDENADRIERELSTHGIETAMLFKNKGLQTGLHPVIVYGGERTIFSHHEERSYSLKKIKDYTKNCAAPKWIYYTSISPGFEQFQKELSECLMKHREIAVAFNPGTYHMKAGANKLKDILQVTHVLFVNLQEALKLAGHNGDVGNKGIIGNKGSPDSKTDLENLHMELQTLGPKLTIITDGKKGASGYDGKELVKIPAYKVDLPVKDKTGAGDSFAAGVLAALNYNKPLKTSLIWGVINSSFVIREIGAIHGLKNKKEIEKLTSEFEKSL